MALRACRSLTAFPPSFRSQLRSLLLASTSTFTSISIPAQLLPHLRELTASTARASSSTSAPSTATTPLSLATLFEDAQNEGTPRRKQAPKKLQGMVTREQDSPRKVSTREQDLPRKVSTREQDSPRKVSTRKRNSPRKSSSAAGADPVDVKSFPFAEKSFGGLKLSPEMQRRLAEVNLTVPTDVQVAAIPVVLDGHDAAIQSYTGSGKTLAYLLPILSKVGPLGNGGKDSDLEPHQGVNREGVQVLIVVPSRELAMQIVREAERILSVGNRRVIQQLIGGANPSRQEEGLKKNKPLIVVGTPGRISELSRAGKLHTHACRFLVLDEADQLLSSKFSGDMKRILEHVGQRRSAEAQGGESVGEFSGRRLEGSGDAVSNGVPKKERPNKVERQTILVSATMPPGVLRAAVAWGHRPRLVRATSVVDVEASPGQSLQEEGNAAELRGARESMPPNLEHFHVICPIHHRVDKLRRCIHALEAQSVIVFMNHSRRLKDTEYKLTARGIAASTLSGELNKFERANVIANFRSGKLRVLVASEVGARGLDVPACDLVVNLELPTDGSHYAHRGGRTGRLGRRGTVVSICEASEEFVLEKFERQLGINIVEADLSDGQLKPREKAKAEGIL